jgi:hypothetical protein
LVFPNTNLFESGHNEGRLAQPTRHAYKGSPDRKERFSNPKPTYSTMKIAVIAILSCLSYATMVSGALNGPCYVGNTPGACLDISDCNMGGGVVHNGYCPYDPPGIKCCTKNCPGGNCRPVSICPGRTLTGNALIFPPFRQAVLPNHAQVTAQALLLSSAASLESTSPLGLALLDCLLPTGAEDKNIKHDEDLNYVVTMSIQHKNLVHSFRLEAFRVKPM